ncbi:MAG: Holliday junction resolvase RuvX [Nitrosomonas sp.]|nr:MAG: Holliday junction resolvase RuvX [Nitrosomonas sp.]
MIQMQQGCVLAFDFGIKRIGVAVGNTLLGTAKPLETIDTEVTERRFMRIARLIETWQPVLLVVGLPLHSDGTPHQLTQLSQRFAQRLTRRFNCAVILQDERYTSETAGAELRAVGIAGRAQKPMLDQVAAQHILQSFFNEQYAITGRGSGL